MSGSAEVVAFPLSSGPGTRIAQHRLHSVVSPVVVVLQQLTDSIGVGVCVNTSSHTSSEI